MGLVAGCLGADCGWVLTRAYAVLRIELITSYVICSNSVWHGPLSAQAEVFRPGIVQLAYGGFGVKYASGVTVSKSVTVTASCRKGMISV